MYNFSCHLLCWISNYNAFFYVYVASFDNFWTRQSTKRRFLLKWWYTRHDIRLIQNPGIQCVGRYWKYGYFVYNWRQLFLAGYRIISGYPAFSIIGYLAEYHQAFHIRHPARYRKGPDYSAGCLVSRISGVGYPCMLKNPLAKNGIPGPGPCFWWIGKQFANFQRC